MCRLNSLCNLFQNVGDSSIRSLDEQKSLVDVFDKSKPWELTEIVDPSKCRTVTLPDSADPSNKVFSGNYPL